MKTKKRWICDKCKSVFASKQSRNRHSDNYCKASAFMEMGTFGNRYMPKVTGDRYQIEVKGDTRIDSLDSLDSHGSGSGSESGDSGQVRPQGREGREVREGREGREGGEGREGREGGQELVISRHGGNLAPVKDMHMQSLVEMIHNLNDSIAERFNETDQKIREVSKISVNGSELKKSEENKDPNEGKIDIVCLAKGDYIKKLIQLHDGDEEKAMNYIKNVGIATDFLEGDFRLIKKIYFDGKKKSQFPIRIKDYKRNKLEYLEENGEWILDIRGEIVGKRLCENIVSTLLIANTQFNEVIINEPDEDRKELLLDLFQINKTQAHIMKLLERKTQGKLCRRVAEFINYCTEVQAETGSLDNVKKVYD